jgi:hypothetical protein
VRALKPRNNNVIQRKISIINAKKSLQNLKHLKLIDFEEQGSKFVVGVEPILIEMRKIKSKPTFKKTIGESEEDLSWLQDKLLFLKDENEWLIVVPNTVYLPIWANVAVRDYNGAISEMWDIGPEFCIAIKKESKVTQVFIEEYSIEVHISN